MEKLDRSIGLANAADWLSWLIVAASGSLAAMALTQLAFLLRLIGFKDTLVMKLPLGVEMASCWIGSSATNNINGSMPTIFAWTRAGSAAGFGLIEVAFSVEAPSRSLLTLSCLAPSLVATTITLDQRKPVH